MVHSTICTDPFTGPNPRALVNDNALETIAHHYTRMISPGLGEFGVALMVDNPVLTLEAWTHTKLSYQPDTLD